MKKLLIKGLQIVAMSLLASTTLISCEKSETPSPDNKVEKWVKYYSNVSLGSQDNNTIGSFLKTQTGEVIKLENAYEQQGYMAMMFFTDYGGYNFITFPGNAYDTWTYKNDHSNRLIFENNLGTNFWLQDNLNSGEITTAATSSKTMTSSEFNQLSSSLSWKDFDAKFKEFNSGDANLSFVANYYNVENGTIYMIQLNNEIRGFLLVKNVANSSNGAFVKFDLIIEGGGAYNNKEATKKIAPGKD